MSSKWRSALGGVADSLMHRFSYARYDKSRAAHLGGFVEDLLETRDVGFSSISSIVFSCNRPLQLDATLRSLTRHLDMPTNVTVLYRCTESATYGHYEELKQRHQDVAFLDETKKGFKISLLDLIESQNTKKIFFLVDDIIFIRPTPLRFMSSVDSRWIIPSLRLGSCLTSCYTKNCKQPLPTFILQKDPSWLVWEWRQGQSDWGYPLSLDGHIFDRHEIFQMIKAIDFRAPNSLENGLQIFSPNFMPRFGISGVLPSLVNIPCNRVQSEYLNRSGTLSVKELNTAWANNLQINIDAFENIKPSAAHQEFTFQLQPR